MAHGAPDYSNVKKEEFTYRVDDLAELAARLGSINVYERRGEVIFSETFKFGFNNWQASGTGAGNAQALYVDDFESEGFCVKLTGGSDGARSAKIFTQSPYLAASVIALETRLLVSDDVEYIKLTIDQYTGSKQYYNRWRIDPVNGKLAVILTGDVYEDVADIKAISAAYPVFHYAKLVVDFNNNVYVRGLFNNQVIDLSSYALPFHTDTTEPHIVIAISMNSTTGNNGYVLVDNVIITRND